MFKIKNIIILIFMLLVNSCARRERNMDAVVIFNGQSFNGVETEYYFQENGEYLKRVLAGDSKIALKKDEEIFKSLKKYSFNNYQPLDSESNEIIIVTKENQIQNQYKYDTKLYSLVDSLDKRSRPLTAPMNPLFNGDLVLTYMVKENDSIPLSRTTAFSLLANLIMNTQYESIKKTKEYGIETGVELFYYFLGDNKVQSKNTVKSIRFDKAQQYMYVYINNDSIIQYKLLFPLKDFVN